MDRGARLATAARRCPSGARRALLALAVGALLLATAAAPPVSAESRHALVVGNAGYAVGPLPNARNDAEAIARVLSGVGFTVTKLVDADNASLRRAVADLGRRLRETGDVGLFFFAGHGLQIEGENYLVPVGADIRQARDVVVEGLALAAAGALLYENAPPAVSEAFLTTRLAGRWRHTYGQGLERADVRAIIDRALPAE